MPDTDRPAEPAPAVPIPLALRHLPVLAGMAVPWITLRTPDGRPVFGVLDADRRIECLRTNRCQVCGFTLQRPVVLLARAQDLVRGLTAEPAMHPWCAHYTQRACPMIAGRSTHYRTTPRDLTAGHGDEVTIQREEDPAQTSARRAAAAEPWFSVWAPTYQVVHDPRTGALSASWAAMPYRVRRIRRQSTG